MRRLARTAVCLALSAATGQVALAQANPLAGGGGGRNPLGADSTANDPLAGSFRGERYALTLKPDGNGRYTGVFRMGAAEYPAAATGNPAALKGSFTADGGAFDFTATLSGDTLSVTTGGNTQTLKRDNAAPNPPVPDGIANIAARGKFEVIKSTATGQSIFEVRAGARSAKALLGDAVKDLTAYLGVKPIVAGAFADVKDLRGGASFTARVRGDRAIRGMILVGIGDKGGAVNVVFDSADAPPKALSALAAASAPPAEVKWEDVRLPDGSGSMRLPVGWRITSAAKGAVDVVGPDGQYLGLGMAYPVNTPQAEQAFLQSQAAAGIRPQPSGMFVAPFPADPVKALESIVPYLSRMSLAAGGPGVEITKIVETMPIQFPGGNAAFVHAVTLSGTRGQTVEGHSIVLSSAAAMPGGTWLFYSSTAAAPTEVFARDLPLMMQVWASWRVDDRVLRERLQQAMANMRAAGEMTRTAAASNSKVRDNANADFSEVIRGYRTVEDTQTGERREADLGNVTRIVDKMNEGEGYARYKEIPLRDQ